MALDVRWQVDDLGVLTPVKNAQRRLVPLFPEAVEAIEGASAANSSWRAGLARAIP
jgi:hypothetical protein